MRSVWEKLEGIADSTFDFVNQLYVRYLGELSAMEIGGIGAIILICALGIVLLRRTPSRLGRKGEAKLKRELTRVFRGSPHQILHDVTLPDYDGTAQIDFILIAPSGVTTVECKNLSGWIYGRATDRQWTQTFRRTRYQFQNPLHQSYNHRKTVQTIAGLQDHQISSLVVFTGKAKFKSEVPANLIHLRGVSGYFRQPASIVLQEHEINELADTIKAASLRRGLVTDLKHRKHIKQVKKRPKCPRCGSRMIRRTAKKGKNAGSEFWGCSRFPRCSGTLNIDK